MNLAVASPGYTLADLVRDSLVVARAGQARVCVWCGSADVATTSPAGGHRGVRVVCRSCGSELSEESPSAAAVDLS